MVIEILQAGTGDSIWVSHNKKNIVIDGGKSTAAIRAKYSKMPQDEIIDLLVVTHIDSDHIAGIIALVKHMKEIGETHRLKQVWFNFPKKEETDEYSVGEGNELTSLLLEIDGLFWNNNTSELLGSTIEFGDIKLHVLAPDHDVAYENKPKEPDELGVRSDDWYIDLRTLIDNVDDDDIDEGGTNSQSIIILAECEGKKLAATPCKIPVLKQASLFACMTGLRISDILKLDWRDFEVGPDQGYYIRICTEKTETEATLPISQEALELCGEWGTGKVFKGLTRSMTHHPLKQWIAEAGIRKHITFHCFRHSYAVIQISLGTDIYTVSKMLTHKNVTTTQIYADLVNSKKRETANKISLK